MSHGTNFPDQALQDLGWTEGKNLRADYRWRGEFISSSAAELVKLAPDLILAAGSSNLAAVQQATRTIPIVFTNVTDPVGSGFVASLSRPGAATPPARAELIQAWIECPDWLFSRMATRRDAGTRRTHIR